MKNITNILSLAFILVVTYASVNVTNLNENWEFEVTSAPDSHQELLKQKLTTNLPSTLHLDLLKHSKIEDPFYRNNYNSLKWISTCGVNYTKKFKVIQTDLDRAIEIVFHGIDTYAKITINGHEILIVKNAFRKYSARVEKFLNHDENILQVSFETAEKYDESGQLKNNMPFKYAQTRKACYQYSWDWAPEIVTVGIWKNVELHVYDEIKIDYVWARNRLVSEEKATINFATKFILNLFKNEKLTEGHTLSVHLNDKKLSEVKIHEDSAYVDVHILKPKLWWPNGIGEPYIYDFLVKLNKNGETIEEKKIPYGIRTVELDLKEKQFKVVINGNPVYAKGSNYVPLDMLYPRISNKHFQNNNTYTIEKLLSDAVSSNFNMIRIWGGGQYESDEYLELASRKGIMIFYDFMFSDSIYPSTPEFLENVEEEVKQQIRRARNYPCLALWSGNNEILQGIQDWGWGNQAYRNDYHLLFEKLIAEIVKIESPYISYIASSPIYGVGNGGFERGGDIHYWGVWAGGSPFESYEGAIGSFNSEFGTQGLPVWHTIKQFTKEDERSYSSEVFKAHERHGSQFNTLRNYMSTYLSPSKDFENEAYLSGVLQAFAMEIAIRAQRTSKPKSYGTLYWQMNDAWPAISWSSIDYYGRWKPLQYMVKRIYPDISIFGLENGNVMAVNDKLYPVEVEIKVKKIYFNGTIISEEEKKATLPADSSFKVHQISPPRTPEEKNNIVLYTEISYKKSVQMSSTKYFTAFKNLNLPKASLQVSYKPDSNEIILKSTQLIKNLFIDHNEHYVQFSDNYFDLLPNSPVTVKVLNGDTLQNIKSGLKYNSIRQASINGEELEVTFN